MHYTLTLAHDPKGPIIDSSRARNEPFTFSVGRGEVIRGWDKAVLKMSLGERGTLIVPSMFGYGSQGTGGIPPDSDLSFDVEMLSVNDQHSAAAGIEAPYDPLGIGMIAVVSVISASILFFVVCRGVGKRTPRPGAQESKDDV